MRRNGRDFQRIYAIGRRLSRFGLCACFPRSRRRRRRRCLGSSCSGPELQSAQIIEKRFARGAKLNGATGEERHRRKSREVAVSESGNDRINSSQKRDQNAVMRFRPRSLPSWRHSYASVRTALGIGRSTRISLRAVAWHRSRKRFARIFAPGGCRTCRDGPNP